jgi:hypothetical protein
MDTLSLVIGALAAGASQGLSDAAIGDAYRRLKDTITTRLGRGRALEDLDVDPAAWAPLLHKAGVADDGEVVALAERVLAVADPVLLRVAGYVVDVSGARGVQVGDGNTQHNTFG